MTAKYCTVQFVPGTSGLGVLRFKGLLLESGKPVEVKSDMAGWLQRECPRGGEIKVLKGDVEAPPERASAAKLKESIRKAEAFARPDVDLAEALKSIPRLSEKQMQAMKDARSPEEALKTLPPELRSWIAISLWVTGDENGEKLALAIALAE